jgi:hypothetical protein
MLVATGLALPDGEVTLAPGEANKLLLAENYSIGSSPMFRAEAFLRAGGFDESLKASEDFDLIYRMARTAAVGLLGSVGFRRRRHGGSLSRRTIHGLDYKLRSRQKLRDMETDPELRRLLDRYIAECHCLRQARAVQAGVRGFTGTGA